MSAPCAACAHPNPATSKFCIECGAAMLVGCPTCGTPAPRGQKFCGECGQRVDASAEAPTPAPTPAPAPAPESERKQVTVLFADVAKSMDLAERLDPDELSQVMTGLVEVCREAVEAFGGTIDKFTGDGVMALFGAPIAQEDHARRACHAALRLVEGAACYGAGFRARGVCLDLRIGLNSGDVVAGAVGGGSYTAIGHTVGLAQRMESLAKPGTPYLSEHTAALVADGFILRGLGKSEVKGSALPLGIFALEGASGGSAAPGRRRSGSARLVGRDTELATLQAALVGAQQGRAQIVGLVGEAGAGKSRLCEELARRAAELGVIVRHTAGVSHAQTAPLLPIVGLLQNYFGVNTDDDPAQIRRKAGERLLGLDPELESELGLIFDFLEVLDPARPAPQLGPEARRRRILEILRRAGHKRSEHTTLLLILEDLHWFDPQSVAFLEAWFPTYPGTRTLVVTNFRPEFHAPWMGHSFYRQLPLAPLDDPAVADLLGELLGPGPGLAALAEHLLPRAGGNPFFAEEIVRGLADEGTLSGEPGAYTLAKPAAEVRVPATVQAVLSARIDRLPGADKHVLQAAAVIGRTFTDSLLAKVLETDADSLANSLQALRTAELLQSTGEGGEYRFWHPLTQEVAYGTLLGVARRRLHGAVAQALLAAAPDRHDELATLVATHYETAGLSLEAARWQLRAGSRVLYRDFPEADRRLRRAIEHLASVSDTEEKLTIGVQARMLRLRLGARIGMDGAEADRLIAEARVITDRLGNLGLQAWLRFAEGTFRAYTGGPVAAGASFRAAADDLDLADEPIRAAFARAANTLTNAFTGPLFDGLHAIEIAIAACEGDPTGGAAEVGVSIPDAMQLLKALVCLPSGRLEEAGRHCRTALECFELRPAAEWRAWTLALLAELAQASGDPTQVAQAARAAGQSLELARDTGSIVTAVKAGHARGIVACLEGRPAEGAAILAESLAEARQHRSGLLHEPDLLVALARAHLACGDSVAARVAAEEAIGVASRQGTAVVESHAHAVRALVLRETATCEADLSEARAAVTAGEKLATDTGALTYAAFLAEERARLDPGPAARHAGLKLAADAYTAIGATGHARRLRDELAAR